MTNDTSSRPRQPRIRHNDYAALDVPATGSWEPTTPVSVVVPGVGSLDHLDLVLAAINAQSYPDHLLEVVVVDSGTGPPISIPRVAPDESRVVPARPGGSGLGNAVRTGVEVAEGEVILLLRPDLLIDRDHVESHLRWHQVADYLAVVGTVGQLEPSARPPSPEQVFQAVHNGRFGELVAHESVADCPANRIIEETNGLLDAGSQAFRAVSRVAISWSLPMYRAAGGMDPDLSHGSEVELGYRMAQAGAVFVHEPRARSWRIGVPPSKATAEHERRCRLPVVSQRVPLERVARREPGRQWKVPYIEVVVEVGDSTYEDVRATVTGVLASTLPDVAVTILGRWSSVPSQHGACPDEPLLDLQLVQTAFSHDGRVQMRESIPVTAAPAPFRFICPAGLVPTADALRRLVEFANTSHHGLLLLAFPTGRIGLQVARLERTEAMARAALLVTPSEDIVDVVEEIFGTHWLDGTEWALVTAAKASTAWSVPRLAAELDNATHATDELRDELDQRNEEIERLRRELASRALGSTLRRTLRMLRGRVGSGPDPMAGARA